VKLGSFGKEGISQNVDEFYLLPIVDLQKIIEEKYSAFLVKVNHIRPKNANSHHTKIKKNSITQFKDNWNCIVQR